MTATMRILLCGAGDGAASPVETLLKTTTPPDACASEGDSIFAGPPARHLATGAASRSLFLQKRKFIVAQPSQSDETLQVAATCSPAADIVIVMVDAREGMTAATRRLSFIAALHGARHLVLTVEQMDSVGHSQAVFDAIVTDYLRFASTLGGPEVAAIPVSAESDGGNVVARSGNMTWYQGPTLIEHLDTLQPVEERTANQLRFVLAREHEGKSGKTFSGVVASGELTLDSEVIAIRSGRASRVVAIVSPDGSIGVARSGQQARITLADEIDIVPGDVLAASHARPHVADQFTATIVWFGKHALVPGRIYILRTAADDVAASITELKYRHNVETHAQEAAKSLDSGEIGVCNVSVKRPIAFDSFADNRATGTFVLIDGESGATVGLGTILHPLRRATNISWEPLDIDKRARAALKQQRPAVLWFTGLSGSGKSTVVNLLAKRLHAAGRHTYVLDGDNVRHGLNRDLGFTEEDRVENIRRVGEVARLMVDAGLIVLVALISPYRADRRMVRELMDDGDFVEIFVDTPLDECVKRDRKGLYARALKGEIKNFTGIDSPYEPPADAEVRLETVGTVPEDLVAALEIWLRQHRYC